MEEEDQIAELEGVASLVNLRLDTHSTYVRSGIARARDVI